MKKRSAITLALLSQGYLSGSKELKNAYQRERRKNKEVKEKDRQNWKAFYERKKMETHGEWNKKRITAWRKSNPLKWKALAKRASEKGINKRFYDKHRERIRETKRKEQQAARRKDPLFGIWAEIRSGDIERVKSAIEKLGRIIDGLD